MTDLVLVSVLAGFLFRLAFLTMRRFGVLGLALAAGAIMSELWVGDLTPLVAQTGIVILRPPLESLVAATLLLLPAAFLFISGPVYRGMRSRVTGALLFALLAVFLMLDIFESALVIEGVGQTIFTGLTDWRMLGTSALLILAIFDGLGIRTPKPEKPAKH